MVVVVGISIFRHECIGYDVPGAEQFYIFMDESNDESSSWTKREASSSWRIFALEESMDIYSWTSPMMKVNHGRDAQRRVHDELSHWESPWINLSCNSTMEIRILSFSPVTCWPPRLITCRGQQPSMFFINSLQRSLNWPWSLSSDHDEIWSWSPPA